MVFGFGTSSPQSTDQPAAPTREQRAKCWATRDAFFACLDKNGITQPDDGELGDKKGVCKALRDEYEGSCGKSWIDYFNKRRILEARQAATLAAAAKQREEAAKR